MYNDNYNENNSTSARIPFPGLKKNPNPNYVPPIVKADIKPYNIETITVAPGDVILAHISKDCDIETAQYVLEEMNKTFPNNSVLLANEHILQGLTIIKPEVGNVNIKFDDNIPSYLTNNNMYLFEEEYDWLL